ncbi:hypothetical protein BO70DRAFT_395119 [Aspergillus heteromorphus CBS 117.55]|uniref:Zn(2)-C6 fungal-type domain-containing protein n=1 Tax=Aspergillus heteromorphus CBS 117.55 TaxID=1448321 RepID=A0A317WI67_9EURO|nr:uncharacterized protein BO70DRAFT_395119 [Aspergillus heteromorphus CBS 117.55]PWY85989.1 hypothetical protein BO70DRAFT_395119 [Aspergillus heteromorphus CBS 117.55]
MDPRARSQNPAPKRSRLMVSRARTGCLTCKSRRVKCDEQKPICNRCVSANRHCAGYQTPPKTPPKPFHITYYVPDLVTSARALHYPTEDLQDQQALAFFYQWSRSCFPSELVAPFTDSTVLQEPALRHAMIAQGKLYETYHYGLAASPQSESTVFAMRHYGKALRELISSDAKATDDRSPVFVIASFLFGCLETCQGHHKNALLHLQSGFKLFQELRQSGQLAEGCEMIFRSLFTRLICQMTHFDLADCTRFFGLDANCCKGPEAFTSIADARIHLINILQKMIHRRHSASPNAGFDQKPIALEMERLGTLLAQELMELDTWILAFNHYLSFGISNNHTCESYVLAICCFLLKFRIMADYRKPGEHDRNDRLDFKHILDLGHTLSTAGRLTRDSSSQSVTANSGQQDDVWCPLHQMFETNYFEIATPLPTAKHMLPHFLFFDILCSLSVASVHAPDPIVRQQARDLVLNACQCAKGWDSSLAIYLAHCLSQSGQLESYHDDDTFFGKFTPETFHCDGSERLIALVADFGKL